MMRDRSDEQVTAAGAAIDRALAAGLTEEQMVALITARHGWTMLGELDPTTICPALLDAVHTPAAVEWDAIFTYRARAELSDLSPNVTP